MNYIRGAVNAISAPYQYYKDLPPINPSTLTGAIDVIVIQRPTDNGDIELACSPFHVRFGKWQVLRPGEKKVNVTVNGHPIPYSMKIGEAGEAFFVFETDGEVPEDLITSPILQPTRTDESTTKDGPPDVDSRKDVDVYQDPNLHAEGMGLETSAREAETDSSEPEYFELDAQSTQPAESQDPYRNGNTTPRQSDSRSLPPMPSAVPNEEAVNALPSPPPTPTHKSSMDISPEMAEQDRRVDASLKSVLQDVDMPQVQVHHGIAIDAGGYHTRHDRERSDRTVRSSERSATPSPVRLTHSTNKDDDFHDDDETLTPVISFPSFRATSEPPHDADDLLHLHPAMPQTQSGSSLPEYSWEWGAFPQPSPLKSAFNKSNKWPWNKGMTKEISGPDMGEEERDREHEFARSKSVPPELDGSPSRERRIKELVAEYYEDVSDGEGEDTTAFGHGGKLRPSKKDSTTFVLQIEGRRVPFELSLVPLPVGNDHEGGVEPEEVATEERRGRRNRHSQLGASKFFNSSNEVEAARIFACGKVDFETFLRDEEVVHHPGLVIRWAGVQYITRSDGSPLMHSLISWRNATSLWQAQNQRSRSESPHSDESNDNRPISPSHSSNGQPDERQHHRSKSEPPEKGQGKPTSISWVRWWRRSGRKKNELDDAEKVELPAPKAERPGLRETASAPTGHDVTTRDTDLQRPLKEILPAGSAPAYPSSPVPGLATTVPPVAEHTLQPPPTRRKFAKTLRLTSDQLKALNLKPGPNPITFSLSTSGVIACTARIFVWSTTDSIVVSDIDGTITKSDGLGHVFAMIGRDWTHLGVAKLYTDIARNGYKIMYLTSRAIGQADATRGYLKGIKQNDYQLPEGPVIMSPDRLMASLHREVIMRKPEVFKMACLRDIRGLFGEASRNPFYAGFGNRITDALSYRSVNVPSARIFTIDSASEVKMELLELAGYKSSYIHMTDLVDQMFPPIHRKWTPEFTDFNFWKVPVQDFPLPDLSPPSPALSARSDTSTLARLRYFSLVPSRQTSTSRKSTSPADKGEGEERKNLHARQTSISSLGKLSNTFGFSQTTSESRRSTSPESSSAYDSDDEDGEEGEPDIDGRRRRRRKSMTSMPGTLDEMHFDLDEYDEELQVGQEGEMGDVVGEGEAFDEAFDEDILAAGEMQKVPFL